MVILSGINQVVAVLIHWLTQSYKTRSRPKLNIAIECAVFSRLVKGGNCRAQLRNTATQTATDLSVLTEFTGDSFSTFCLV